MSSGAESPSSTRKKDRSTLPTLAAIGGCVLFAYGFSRDSALIQWVLPSLLVAAAVGWTWWSGRSARGGPAT